MSPLNSSDKQERVYWRSTDQLANTDEFQKNLNNEFIEEIDDKSEGFTRRGFMKFMGASMALAGAVGLPGCRRPEEKILPYAKAPEDLIPGKAQYYASALPRTKGSIGILVRSNEGRPTKLTGLVEHPANQGAADSQAQAELLELYDPSRLKYVQFDGDTSLDVAFTKDSGSPAELFNVNDNAKAYAAELSAGRKEFRKTWKKLEAEITALSTAAKANKGADLAILASPAVSPTEKRLLKKFKATFPQAQVYTYETFNDDNSIDALQTFLGREKLDRQVRYNLAKTDTVVTFDNDFMQAGNDSLRLSRDFSDRRRIYKAKDSKKAKLSEKTDMNRLYSIEANFSITGSNADHRMRVKSSEVQDALFALAEIISKKAGLTTPAAKAITASYQSKLDLTTQVNTKFNREHYLNVLAEELIANKKAGKTSAILVGDNQPKAAHLLAFALNELLGNIGTTVEFTERVAQSTHLQKDSITLLATALDAGKVKDLVILGGNVVDNAPADLKIADKIKKASGKRIHLSAFANETSAVCNVTIPRAHFLEAWGDTLSYDGTLSFVQPLISPLWGAWSDIELLSALVGEKKKSHALVQETHGFDKATWEKSIYQGFVKNSGLKALPANISWDKTSKALAQSKSVAIAGLEVNIAECPKIADGRFRHNGWLMELPDPISKLTWDNAALVSMTTADKNGWNREDVISIEVNGAKVEAPVWTVPGHADDVITLYTGYSQGGDVDHNDKEVQGSGGFDIYPIRTTAALYTAAAKATKTGATYTLASTQDHWAMEGRELVKEADIKEFNINPNFAEVAYDERAESLFDGRQEFLNKEDHQWAMVIDLNACNGCGSCTVSCQAENNISVASKLRVLEGREMHWIRMDRYFYHDARQDEDQIDGETANANYDLEVSAVHQPIPCMHCENAPCEQVCPVAATQHSPSGLNDMAYNRCIGTRYCLNNCPFKVRRYNYFNFQEEFKNPANEVKKMVFNPNVTMRSRGVMEKCTYCVQRINEASIDAKVKGDRAIPANSFTTACAESCPTQAITFGNQNNVEDKLVSMQNEARGYTLLPQLNVRPRTSFLARLKNQNEQLTVPETKEAH